MILYFMAWMSYHAPKPRCAEPLNASWRKHQTGVGMVQGGEPCAHVSARESRVRTDTRGEITIRLPHKPKTSRVCLPYAVPSDADHREEPPEDQPMRRQPFRADFKGLTEPADDGRQSRTRILGSAVRHCGSRVFGRPDLCRRPPRRLVTTTIGIDLAGDSLRRRRRSRSIPKD